jgi:hypothetical protein
MSQFDWLITPKKKKTMEAPQNRRFYFEVPPLWPTYIGERRTTFAKSIWDKSEVL